MVQYFTSVFTILLDTASTVNDGQLSLQDTLKITPTELALVTAQEAFEKADLNQDGKISFEEFQRYDNNNNNNNNN